ncbi:hypothetical protein C8F01DRAFT_1366767 [Mycena amicta]|nr:hypothetical protein C8F01DRAFT_1366767 [Mycena amicta]
MGRFTLSTMAVAFCLFSLASSLPIDANTKSPSPSKSSLPASDLLSSETTTHPPAPTPTADLRSSPQYLHTATIILVCIVGAAALFGFAACARNYFRTAHYDVVKAEADLTLVRREVELAERELGLGLGRGWREAGAGAGLSVAPPPPPYLRPPSYALSDPMTPIREGFAVQQKEALMTPTATKSDLPSPAPVHARSSSAESESGNSSDSDIEGQGERRRLL